MESKAIPFTWSVQRSFAKRFFDIGFSLAVLLLFSPLLLCIACTIFLSSPGKIVFTQIRLGRGGKPFKCYKFRTMHVDAEEHLKEILSRDPLLQAEWEEKQKLKADPRIFPLGRFLRKTSLDELPQFWNVVRGEMSVVGPRPYMFNQRKELGHLAYKILSVRPGITGLWQTSGRSRTTFQQRMELDKRYVDKRSFLYDLGLILKTFPKVILVNNAH